MTNWQDLTMPGLEALGQQTQTVIMPIGSLEEHGPHLPLGTDTFHALEVAHFRDLVFMGRSLEH